MAWGGDHGFFFCLLFLLSSPSKAELVLGLSLEMSVFSSELLLLLIMLLLSSVVVMEEGEETSG